MVTPFVHPTLAVFQCRRKPKKFRLAAQAHARIANLHAMSGYDFGLL